MKELKMYMFRHGQTFYNRDKIFTGWKDSGLTTLGVRQAKTIGKRLAGKKIDIAFCSDLKRAKRTLKEVLVYHPECKKIVIDKRLRERNYGKFNGVKHSTIIEKYGLEEFEKWHRGFNYPPPGGESFAMVERRVKPFLRDLFALMKKKKANVAISAHGNSIRLMRKILEKASEEKSTKWEIKHERIFTHSFKA